MTPAREKERTVWRTGGVPHEARHNSRTSPRSSLWIVRAFQPATGADGGVVLGFGFTLSPFTVTTVSCSAVRTLGTPLDPHLRQQRGDDVERDAEEYQQLRRR